MSEDVYTRYKRKQTQLAKLIKEGSEIIKPLNLDQFSVSLKTLSEKVNNETFKIQVVGTFKNGKSTFINSFLGQDVLPAYATPCTAVINEVKYGDRPRAMLFFKDPLPEKLQDDIPEATMSHIRKYGKNVPPIEIPYDQIEDYAVIPMGKELKDSSLESPYEKIELYWQLDILKNGVEIIDSPGLNECDTRTKVALEYLPHSDAILFVMTALQLCSKPEMDFLQNNLHNLGFQDIHFIINRFDQLGSVREQERVKQFAIQKLSQETTFGEKGIFFTSAYNALQGKLNNNEKLFKESGMADFETSLSDFLVNHRGNVKLLQPARELNRIINDEALFKQVPHQRAMLSSSLDDIKKRYNDAKPQLEAMEEKKRQLSERITQLIERMMPDFRRCVTNYYKDMTAKIPVWINDYEPTANIRLTHVKESAEEVVHEISEALKDSIDQDQNEWSHNTFEPLVTDKVKDMLTSVEQNVENFFIDVDKIRVDISGEEATNVAKGVPLWQRIAGIGGGLLVGDIGLMAAGGAFGFSKQFVKQIVIQISAYIGLALLGFLNPITIIGVIIGGMIFGVFNQKKGLVDKVKAKMIETVTEKINQSSFEATDKILDDLKVKITELGNSIVTAMDTELNELRNQVEDIIKQMEAGKAKVEERKQELNACEEKLKLVCQELNDFIYELVQS
ncbi:MAG TPA: dynamin family protein [Ruminiclostridium sp.]|nr:dynamin family protein [Ruminiclostridium sp.]